MTNHLIILSSPPHKARWVSLTKTTLCSIVIMNPWTREEISKAAVVYGLEANDPRIDEMYNHTLSIRTRHCFVKKVERPG
ncbi:hypothetical protein H4582DRAFT_2024671 [Lactarius indigo]|nr:hypothetical protein H4582DRAFT_2024671 [Lactarius indigo]